MAEALFKIQFDRYFDTLRNYLYYQSGDIELATDLAQDVFLLAWQKRFYSKEPLLPLLYKVAKDTWRSYCRRKKVEQLHLEQFTLLLAVSWEEEGRVARATAIREGYEKGLAAMPKKQRTAFLMHQLEGLTYAEIALRLQVGIKAVEKRMQKAWKHLRAALVAYER
ncbi:MAG: RNA polymerase sigma factor [Aureispira sp.]